MGMVAAERRIASAFFVFLGKHGDVSRHAQEQGICRQFVYREAKKIDPELPIVIITTEVCFHRLTEALPVEAICKDAVRRARSNDS